MSEEAMDSGLRFRIAHTENGKEVAEALDASSGKLLGYVTSLSGQGRNAGTLLTLPKDDNEERWEWLENGVLEVRRAIEECAALEHKPA